MIFIKIDTRFHKPRYDCKNHDVSIILRIFNAYS